MHGGMKVYASSPTAARRYVEAGRGRADDYYLAEGTGIARRFSAADGGVTELAPLTGETYEAWVAGVDPGTGAPRGRLRDDDRAVRFVEVVVKRPQVLVAGRGAAPRGSRRLRRRAGPRRRPDPRLACRARHHPGRSPRQTDAGVAQAAGGGHGAALHLPGRGPAPSLASAG